MNFDKDEMAHMSLFLRDIHAEANNNNNNGEESTRKFESNHLVIRNKEFAQLSNMYIIKWHVYYSLWKTSIKLNKTLQTVD